MAWCIMKSMEAFEILIIILSVVLSLQLILLTFIFWKVLKIMQSVQSMANKADHVASNIGDFSNFMKNSASSAGFGKMLFNFYKEVKKKGNK